MRNESDIAISFIRADLVHFTGEGSNYLTPLIMSNYSLNVRISSYINPKFSI